jgi:hypothetical protein
MELDPRSDGAYERAREIGDYLLSVWIKPPSWRARLRIFVVRAWWVLTRW